MSVIQSLPAMHLEDNSWRGSPSYKISTTSPPTNPSKTIKRKPPPPITPDLLKHEADSQNSIVIDDIARLLSSPSADRRIMSLSQELSLPHSTTSLGRKTSITGHLKNALRRRPSASREPLTTKAMNISAPTDFKHISGVPGESASRPVSGTSSFRSSIASSGSAELMFHLSPLPEHASLPSVEACSISAGEQSAVEPRYLRPARSIRRPMRTTTSTQMTPSLGLTSPTSVRDKRKAMYAATPADLNLISSAISPDTSPYQAATNRVERSWTGSTLDYHARMHRHYHTRASSADSTGEQVPELCRSPSSTFSAFSSDSDYSS